MWMFLVFVFGEFLSALVAAFSYAWCVVETEVKFQQLQFNIFPCDVRCSFSSSRLMKMMTVAASWQMMMWVGIVYVDGVGSQDDDNDFDCDNFDPEKESDA